MRPLLSTLRKFFTRRSHREKDLEEELALHIEMEARKNLAAGMNPEEARRRAVVAFNGVERIKDECRDVRTMSFVEALGKDVRYAARGLSRTPGFSLAAVAIITLGLGLNTAVFTLFNTFLLQPIAVDDPHDLYEVTWIDREEQSHRFSWQELESFRQNTHAFSAVVGLTTFGTRVEGRTTSGQLVTANHFDMLRVRMVRGRRLLPEDAARPGGQPVLVLSHRAWQVKFGGDPHIIGRKMAVRGRAMEVVGIASPEFEGLGGVPVDFWAPVTMSNLLEDGPDLFGPKQPRRIIAVGRLRPRVPVRSAEAEVLAWAQRATADRPEPERAMAASVLSAATRIRLSPQVLATLTPIMAAFGLVLLIACANVANMTLARTLARQREIGIRISLGASRSQLIRQFLVESSLLAVPAACLGFFLAQGALRAGIDVMVATLPPEYADFVTFAPPRPDLRVFAFMFAAAFASSIVFGLAPALQATRVRPILTVREQFSEERPPTGLRSSLVVGQIAVSVLLLICAGVLLRGGRTLERLDPGFQTGGVISLESEAILRSRLLNELANDTQVETVAGALHLPLDGGLQQAPIRQPGTSGTVGYNAVSPEFFSVLRIPILEGRNFTKDEASSGAPVAIVSRKTANRLWPHASATGQTIEIAEPSRAATATNPYRTLVVVGVAGDVTHGWIGFGNDPSCLYTPLDAKKANGILVRARGEAGSSRRLLESRLNDRLPGSVRQIHVLANLVSAQLYPIRAGYGISIAVGILALLLTLSGIYGVLSYLVAQRTKEIGIRIALGADTITVTRMVLSESTRLTTVGVLIGVAAAFAAARALSSLLILMNVFDVLAFCGGAAVVAAASLTAAYIPARRASRMDPLVALRID